MRLFFEHVDDVIALLIVTACLILLFMKCDGSVWSVITMAAGYVFGKVSSRAKINGA